MPTSCARLPAPVYPMLSALLLSPEAAAWEVIDRGGLRAELSVAAHLGLRQGAGINFGAGALDGSAERERTDLQLGVRPRLTFEYAPGATTFYGGASAAAGTTTLDGELSGLFGRSGDAAFDRDEAYAGLRHGPVDLSVGGQAFSVGDGFIIGDGTFDTGRHEGQYWTGLFGAWRNSAIARVNGEHVRADAFWLRASPALGRAEVAGVNVETGDAWLESRGRIGAMYFAIVDDDGLLGWDGLRVAGVRGSGLHLPAWPRLQIFGEYVVQRGERRATGVDNAGDAWYVEGLYTLPDAPWTPDLAYRYGRFSGDDPASADNEDFRAFSYSFGKRDWDTWYQGEVVGEAHLFNQNQVTQMLKVRAYPRAGWTLGAAYFHHDLQQPHYFGVPVRGEHWADEVNAWVDHYPDDRLYFRAFVAWATPGVAARQVFGDDDQIVIGLWLTYTLR